MQLPDHSTYTDVLNCSQIPKVTFEAKHHISSQMTSFMKENVASSMNRDIPDLFGLLTLVIYTIGSVVWAEMKKQTSYKVDISLDTHGVVHEAQCECGAGQGPTAHCKHVTTVLYALHRLSVDGSVLTEQTCTQVLQTFHHVKPYTGSPMTTADLHKLRSQNYIYDPRPKERIDCSAYQSHFRNTVLSFQTKERMPLTQLYKPANPYALFSDHQYLQSSDLFLQQET